MVKTFIPADHESDTVKATLHRSTSLAVIPNEGRDSRVERMIEQAARTKAEIDYCWDLEELWAVVRESGIDPQEVRYFSFSPLALEVDEMRQLLTASDKAQNDAHLYWHNCVRLWNGKMVPIPVTRRPYRP